MRASDFILKNTVDEAKMNPSSFANAIKEGGDKGVLVGFEFEVCVPAKTLKKAEKDYEKIISDNFSWQISFNEWPWKPSEFHEIAINPKLFDKHFVIKPGAGKYKSFEELIKNLSDEEKEDRTTYGDLMYKMFNDTSSHVERNLTSFFTLPNPKKTYQLLKDTQLYDLDDEYEEDPGYSAAARVLKPAVEKAMGADVTVFDEYHEASKDTTSWYIEPDGSLDPNEDDGSAEIVSPPLPADQAMDALKSFYAMAKQLKLYTSADNNTGLHINVSIPGNLDVLKLAAFLGDQYVLKYFGRESNEYAHSVIGGLSDYDTSKVYKTKGDRRKKNKVMPGKPVTRSEIDYKRLANIIRNETSDHFASISNNGKYISFRHAGGNYLNDYSGVLNIVGRFIQAMIIASDPELYKQEYIKKLVKIFGSPTSQGNEKLSNIQRAKDIIQLMKTQGVPALEISMMYPKGRNRVDWENVEENTIYNNTAHRYVHKYFDRDKSEIVFNSQLAKKNITKLLRGAYNREKKQEVSEMPLDNFAYDIVYPQYDTDVLAEIYENLEWVVNRLVWKTISPVNKGLSVTQVKIVPFTDPAAQQFYKNYIGTLKMMEESLLEAEEHPIYYFAYGMLTDPKYMFNSELVGVAELKNFEYKLYRYANVEPETGNTTYGTLWKINRETLSHLDKIEGYPKLYDRRTYPVYVKGQKYPAEVYVMTPQTLDFVKNTKPNKDYLRTVGRGYINAGVPTQQLHKALRNDNVSEEFHTGGSLGLPFPGTYEQENNKFKTKGPRRITAMTYEDQGAETITLTDLYKQERPDDNEQIWDYGTMIWDTPYKIKKITPRELDFNLCHQYDVEGIEDLFDKMEPEQHDIVDNYINDPNLSNYIIVMDNGHIVDGNHRAIAAALTKKSLRYIDIGEEDDL